MLHVGLAFCLLVLVEGLILTTATPAAVEAAAQGEDDDEEGVTAQIAILGQGRFTYTVALF